MSKLEKCPATQRLEKWLLRQGCQMVHFQTANPNLGNFWRVLEWKILVFYGHLAILQPFGKLNIWTFVIFCGNLVYFCPILVRRSKKNLATLCSAESKHNLSCVKLTDFKFVHPDHRNDPDQYRLPSQASLNNKAIPICGPGL
jgi:hypothetical protein